jgi:hypothetical protein
MRDGVRAAIAGEVVDRSGVSMSFGKGSFPSQGELVSWMTK